jgi:hypothetical protein
MGIRGKISRNTLAHANQTRDWRIYADFAQTLIQKARQLYANDSFGMELEQTIYALDATTIDLCLSLFPWATFRKHKGAVKLHTLLDLRGNIPTIAFITSGKVHEVNILDKLPIEAGAIYIMDRGYLDYARLYKLHQSAAYFVTRAKNNACMFAEETLRSNKLCALHFHDLRATTVVDVMPHPGTDPLVTKLVCDFAKSISGIVILLHRENQGYVFNAMLGSLFMSALTLAANEVSSVRDIDRAWMGVTYMSMGPFGLMDQVGLDTVWSIIDYWANKQKDVQLQKNAEFVKQYIEIGELGYKTKKGFYTYPKPEYGQDGFLVGNIKK